MNFKIINEKTLEVKLTLEEVIEKGINIEEIEDESVQKDLVATVLEEAENNVDFAFSGMMAISLKITEQMVHIIMQLTKIPSAFFDSSDDSMNPFFQADDISDVSSHPQTKFVFRFEEFDDIIELTQNLNPFYVAFSSHLYHYEGRYFLCIDFNQGQTNEEMGDALSCIHEYAQMTQMTFHYLQEYGKKIMEQDAVEQVYKHFVNSEGMNLISSEDEHKKFSIIVPLVLHPQSPNDLIEVLVDETCSSVPNEVYFETQTNDPDFEFSVIFNTATKEMSGIGAEQHRDFIANIVFPQYVKEKNMFETP